MRSARPAALGTLVILNSAITFLILKLQVAKVCSTTQGDGDVSLQMNIFGSMLVCFLPRRYREIFTPYEIPSEAALWSGILESLVSLGLGIRGYYAYFDERMASMPVEVLTKAGEKGGESAIMGLGSIIMLEYLIHVTTILLVFFMLEGLVRAIAAVASGEALPSLPLQALAFLHTRGDARNRERRLGERIRDEVQPGADGRSLQISSCRPKPWTQLTTISHEGEFYELVRENKGTVPRPFVYFLRKKPQTAVIRGIYAYDPNEVLQAKN